jgi:hypothetical protein
MHKKSRTLSLLIAVSLFAIGGRSAFAFLGGGCVDSPEDPTVVMALLGAGAAAIPFVWSRMRPRRNTK